MAIGLYMEQKMLNGQKLYKVIDNNEPVEYSAEDYAQAQIDYDNYITNELPKEIRRKRNGLLAKSDWTQYPDSPLSAEQKTAWTIYRQALRNVTTQSGFPSNITWPTAPN